MNLWHGHFFTSSVDEEDDLPQESSMNRWTPLVFLINVVAKITIEQNRKKRHLSIRMPTKSHSLFLATFVKYNFFVTEFLLLPRSMTMTVDQEVEAGISRSEKGFLWKSFQTWCQQNASKVNKIVSIRLNEPSSGCTGPGFRLDKYFAMWLNL